MIIEHNFSKYVVFAEDSLLSALNKISKNRSRLIFVVSESGILEGVLSDGDIRRWLTSTLEIDLHIPVSRVMNTQCQSASISANHEDIRRLLSTKVLAVPLLDSINRLVAVALPFYSECNIEGRIISGESPAFLIAEIGNNHNGSLELAKKLIDEAAHAGADCVKFQMRDLKSLYRNAGDINDVSTDLGAQYTLDLLRKYQLSDDNLFRCFEYSRKKGVIPLCTPWDDVSFKKLDEYGLSAYKVSSADFTNYDLIDVIASTGKTIICSTGMAKEQEIREGVRHFQNLGIPFVLLHCNSTYPAPFKDVNLQYILHLKELSGGLVGYSGHERGISVAIAAVSLGAKVIEKHFTLDRTMEGNDHKVSLLPDEFLHMVEGIRQVEEAMGTKGERSLSQGELMNREMLAKSLVATVDVPAGTAVTAEMIAVLCPGQGLQPNRKNDLIGQKLRTAKKAGDLFFPADLDEGDVIPRNYNFAYKWGIPVRYHDLQNLRACTNMDLLEIHLSYKDMDADFRKYINEPLDLGLVVHAPELFAGDHTLDLCSDDRVYRRRSIQELQRVIDLARDLTPFFSRTNCPLIVTNVGGFSSFGHLHNEKVEEKYLLIEDSLRQLDTRGVEIIPQTMPPFPWHFGGQQYHNLFIDAESIIRFCKRNSMRVCLDVSHSKLACNHKKKSFSDFLKVVGPYTAHFHIADAIGVDGEGMQIGMGDIDWFEFFRIINKFAPDATFIPEIWQGHKNNGEGAWIALERLEAFAAEVLKNAY